MSIEELNFWAIVFALICCCVWYTYWHVEKYWDEKQSEKVVYVPPLLTPKPHWYLNEPVKGIKKKITPLWTQTGNSGFQRYSKMIETHNYYAGNGIIEPVNILNIYRCNNCGFKSDCAQEFVKGNLCMYCIKENYNTVLNYEWHG